jgi:hypothetical protein
MSDHLRHGLVKTRGCGNCGRPKCKDMYCKRRLKVLREEKRQPAPRRFFGMPTPRRKMLHEMDAVKTLQSLVWRVF